MEFLIPLCEASDPPDCLKSIMPSGLQVWVDVERGHFFLSLDGFGEDRLWTDPDTRQDWFMGFVVPFEVLLTCLGAPEKESVCNGFMSAGCMDSDGSDDCPPLATDEDVVAAMVLGAMRLLAWASDPNGAAANPGATPFQLVPEARRASGAFGRGWAPSAALYSRLERLRENSPLVPESQMLPNVVSDGTLKLYPVENGGDVGSLSVRFDAGNAVIRTESGVVFRVGLDTLEKCMGKAKDQMKETHSKEGE